LLLRILDLLLLFALDRSLPPPDLILTSHHVSSTKERRKKIWTFIHLLLALSLIPSVSRLLGYWIASQETITVISARKFAFFFFLSFLCSHRIATAITH
jgi:hypothetical protein